VRPKNATEKPLPPYRIGELAGLGRVSRQTVHNYVVLGLLVPAACTGGGHRRFDETSRRRLDLIARLLRRGYTLRDIRELFQERWDARPS
jgi:MerR family mercuric resistance operon transcriptional regulator